MLKKTCLLVTAFMMAASVSFAAGDLGTQLDVDKDGYISAQEAESMPEILEQFDKLDVNKDGKIDMAEIAALSTK